LYTARRTDAGAQPPGFTVKKNKIVTSCEALPILAKARLISNPHGDICIDGSKILKRIPKKQDGGCDAEVYKLVQD
jgi:hypothetical protein